MLDNVGFNSARISAINVTFRLLSALIQRRPLRWPPRRAASRVPWIPSRTAVVAGHVHRLAQPAFDRGAIDPAKKLNYMVLLVKPSAAQQADLDNLLFDQQNPSSASFRNWLTPEQFGTRFGLNTSDQSKIVAWLTSQGFAIDHLARSANWIAFSGTATQVSNALHTPIHQFEVNGEMHFANTAVPSVPEALSGVVGGFLGLNDFHARSNVRLVQPDYNFWEPPIIWRPRISPPSTMSALSMRRESTAPDKALRSSANPMSCSAISPRFAALRASREQSQDVSLWHHGPWI